MRRLEKISYIGGAATNTKHKFLKKNREFNCRRNTSAYLRFVNAKSIRTNVDDVNFRPY